MTNLKAILQPAYEPGDGKADGAQLVDGEWWHPIFGCDSLQKVVDNVRSMRELPPNYIDPEHQGQDRELLEAFYQACRSEGGTADEIHLRGIKAALATQQTALPVPSALSEDWLEVAAVAAFAQDMRARGLAEQVHGDELLKPANQRAAPVNLAALHDPDFSAGLSPGEHLNRLCGVAPNPSPFPTGKSAGRRLPVHESCPANGCSACRDYLPCARLEPLKQVAPAPVLPEPSTRDDLDNLCGPPTLKDVEAASAQPAAIAQPTVDPSPVALGRSGLTPEEIEASFRDWWKDRYESAYFGAAPLSAVIEWTQFALPRSYRPTFQPIPVSERLPGPEDCTPWRDDPTAQPWCWAAKDVDGWEWIQLSMSHLHGNLGRIMLGQGYTHWAPWWAISLPGTTEIVGEGQP
jgi:GNAT superfamily N-acetyltransferase